MSWDVVYEKAIRDDGSLFFPERLTREFLDAARKSQGSYIFANQYQNEVIPIDEQCFKKEWLRYFKTLPDKTYTFAFIDPAISLEENADYTACCVIKVDIEKNWYLTYAQRYRITPTELVELVFRINKEFAPKIIGIEDVAYQKALLYMLDQEMRRRGVILPVTGIKPSTTSTKQMRILGLVPKFEWGRMYLSQGLHDFEIELAQFPRGTHDDLLDSLAYLDQIVYYPVKEREKTNAETNHTDPGYESRFIKNLLRSRREESGP